MERDMNTTTAAVESKKLIKQYKSKVRDIRHLELSNLYLAVERGQTKLTREVVMKLRTLVTQSVDPGHTERIDWWAEELMKLPGWERF
jgi:hypothetical protein